MHDFRGFLIGGVKRAHTAQIAGREAIGCGIGRLQVFRRRDSRAFFAPAADQPADLAVQFHLRELRRHKRVQCGEHGGVICGLANVHWLSPFRRSAVYFSIAICVFASSIFPASTIRSASASGTHSAVINSSSSG